MLTTEPLACGLPRRGYNTLRALWPAARGKNEPSIQPRTTSVPRSIDNGGLARQLLNPPSNDTFKVSFKQQELSNLQTSYDSCLAYLAERMSSPPRRHPHVGEVEREKFRRGSR